jgi:hypothetical protein
MGFNIKINQSNMNLRIFLYGAFISLLMAASHSISAQVVFTSSDFAGPGTTFNFALKEEVSPEELPSGANVTIDFSNLQKDYDYIVEFQSIEGNPSAALFPQSNLVIVTSSDIPLSPVEGVTTFSQVSENEWLIHGFQFGAGEDPDVFSPPLVELIFPVVEGMQESTSSTTTETYYFGFNEIDSARSVLNRSVLFEANTWGELILPDATYDFIQVNRTESIEDSSFFLIEGEWVFQDVYSYSNTDFHFYSPEANGLVLSISETEGFKGQIGWSVIFLENSIVTSQENKNTSAVSVYPIPASSLLKIQLADSEFTQYKLADFSGRTVEEGSLNSNEINVQQYPDGFYFLQLFNMKMDNVIIKKVIIKHE